MSWELVVSCTVKKWYPGLKLLFIQIGEPQWVNFRSQFPPPLSQKLQQQYEM